MRKNAIKFGKNIKKLKKRVAIGKIMCYNRAVRCHSGKKVAFQSNLLYFPEVNMRIRKQALGDKNIVGAKIEQRRKELKMKQFELLEALNAKGIELNASGLSKIEGQIRSVNDYELKAFAEVLKISINDLLGIKI